MFFDVDGQIYDANTAFLQMTGYARESLEDGTLNWKALTPADFEHLDARKVMELERRGVITPYEKEFVRLDGTRVPVLVGGAQLEGYHGGGVSFVLDISDRKKATHALAERARQQEAVAAFGTRSLELDDLGRLLEEAAMLVWRTLDVPMAAVLERRSDGAALVPRAWVGLTELAREGVIIPLTNQTMAGEAVLSGDPIVVHDLAADPRFAASELLRTYGVRSAACVAIHGGVQPFGALAVFADQQREFSADDVNFLTAIANVIGTTVVRHRTERAFRQSQRLEAVGRLASGVAHDFNNMLSAITGYAEIVMHDLASDNPHREDIAEILKAAGRAAGLTRQLLAFSRQQVLQPRTVNLNDIVTGIQKMVERLVGQEIELTLRLNPELDWIKVDPGQVEQVLLNLCVNARDAMPHGGRLVIETSNVTLDGSGVEDQVLSRDARGDYVLLSVTDSGVGMDAETRARIFEPFFTTKGEKGTGLGLATVYGIVKQSAGELAVYSEPGHGSTFKVYLPISDEVPRVSRASGASQVPAVGTETVLFTDDEQAIRKLMQRALQAAGFDVLVAKDGVEALTIFEQHRDAIDILVTDLVMPGISGVELARRAQQHRANLRVLFLSGFAAGAVVDGYEVGSDSHFLQKPFGSQALVTKVREVLDSAA
jgi:PAS domain S-box-containing protein